MSLIHPTALVDPAAELDSSVSVGPYSVIGPNVKIGPGTTVGPHSVIEAHTIGCDNRIFQFVSLGAINQDKKYAGEPCELVIGTATPSANSAPPHWHGTRGGVTRLGNDNWMMAYTHLAHDCLVGNHTIFANNTQLAGHVEVGDWVILAASPWCTSSCARCPRHDGHVLTAVCRRTPFCHA